MPRYVLGRTEVMAQLTESLGVRLEPLGPAAHGPAAFEHMRREVLEDGDAPRREHPIKGGVIQGPHEGAQAFDRNQEAGLRRHGSPAAGALAGPGYGTRSVTLHWLRPWSISTAFAVRPLGDGVMVAQRFLVPFV